MKTITYDQLADLTVDFIASDLTDTVACGVLASATTVILPEEDHKEFMKLVTDRAIAIMLESVA